MADLYNEWYEILHPTDSTEVLALIIIIAFFTIPYLLRNVCGSYWQAMKMMVFTIVGFYVMWLIHPALVGVFVIMAVLAASNVIKGNWPYIILTVVMAAVIVWKLFLGG